MKELRAKAKVFKTKDMFSFVLSTHPSRKFRACLGSPLPISTPISIAISISVAAWLAGLVRCLRRKLKRAQIRSKNQSKICAKSMMKKVIEKDTKIIENGGPKGSPNLFKKLNENKTQTKNIRGGSEKPSQPQGVEHGLNHHKT